MRQQEEENAAESYVCVTAAAAAADRKYQNACTRTQARAKDTDREYGDQMASVTACIAWSEQSWDAAAQQQSSLQSFS